MSVLAIRRGRIAPRKAAGAGAFRGNALGNDGLSSPTSTVAFTIPSAAQVGDVAVVTIGVANSENVNTSAEPSGWTALRSPDRIVGQLTSAWLFAKTLTSGEPGSGVSWTFASSLRYAGHMAVYSQVTLTGAANDIATDNTADTTAPIPTIASVPAGAIFHAHVMRRLASGNTAPDVAAFTGYSQGADERSATAFVGTGSQVAVEASYRLIPSAGTYGGESATVTLSTFGISYAVVLPPV